MVDVQDTEETKKKISICHKGKILSEETKCKLRKPKNISEEQKKKTKELYKIMFKGEKNPMWGRKRPDTVKLNKERAGFKHTDETKRKMSEQRVGEKAAMCKMTKEDILKAIKMKRKGFSNREIAEKYGRKETYIRNIVYLKYKRKDIDYDNLESLLEGVTI